LDFTTTDAALIQRRVIKTTTQLLDSVNLNHTPLAQEVDDSPAFPLRVPHAYLQNIRADMMDPLLLQVLPLLKERLEVPGFVPDPTGDQDASPTPGLLHKYQGRALIITTSACAIHCRYCFRRHYPYTDLPATWQNKLIEYLRDDHSIHEVILSGGDPLMLSEQKLSDWLTQLAQLSHLKRIRIHTRIPIVMPARINETLLASLANSAVPVVMVVHANHAQELSAEVNNALAMLRSRNIWLFNQTVLLRHVNDDVASLRALSEALAECQVVPYYLHQLDPVAGAAHFAVADTQARTLVAQLRQVLPGYLVPRLVREIPGAECKLPL
jgi:EF-P beta-lysylation protein EpmB